MNQLSSILTHYFRVLAVAAGINWDWERSQEIILAGDVWRITEAR